MGLRLFGREADHRNIQAFANRIRDLAQRYTFFPGRVVSAACRMPFENKPIEMSNSENLGLRPPIEAVADVCRNSLLAGHLDEATRDALLNHYAGCRVPQDCLCVRQPQRL